MKPILGMSQRDGGWWPPPKLSAKPAIVCVIVLLAAPQAETAPSNGKSELLADLRHRFAPPSRRTAARLSIATPSSESERWGSGRGRGYSNCANKWLGRVALTDSIRILLYLFSGEDQPPEPFERCGTDLTPPVLECGRYGPCEKQ